MPVPSSTSMTRARSGGDFVRRYLSVATVTTVLACRLNGAALTDTYTGGIYRLPVDTVTTGSIAAALPGYTVLIGTSAGAQDVGVMRIRAAGGADYLLVGEIAAGELKAELADNVYITVINQRRPALLLPRLEPVYTGEVITDFNEYSDYGIAYSNQNTRIPPKANISEGLSNDGTVYLPVRPAGWVDDGQTYRTVTLTALGSLSLADSTIITDYLWAVGDGTITVGTSASASITVRFPVGYRMISLTVEDVFGITHTMYQPIWVHNAANPPLLNFAITGDDDSQGWRELSFDFFGADNSISETVFPKGTLACYWEDARFTSGSADAYEYRGQALGWVTDDAALLRRFEGRYSFRLAGMAYWLSSFAGFPHEQIDTGATAARHFEMERITCDKMTHWQLRFYSNALDLVNFYPTGNTAKTKGIELDEASLWEQIQESQAQNLVSLVRSDSRSAIWCRRSYIHMSDLERADRGTLIEFGPADYLHDPGLTVQEPYTRSIGQVTMPGAYVLGADSYDLIAQAPGLTLQKAPGRGEFSIQRLPTIGAVAILLRLVGREYGRSAARQFDMTPVGNYDYIEPAWEEPISITYEYASPRGTVIEDVLCMVRGISVEHSTEPGEMPKRISYSLEEVTSGQPGMLVPAVEAINVGEEIDPIGGIKNDGDPEGAPRLAFVSNSGYLYWTDDARASTPVWDRANLSLTLTSWGHPDFVAPNLDSPLYTGEGTTVNAVIAAVDKIYTLADVFGAQTLTARKTFAAVGSPSIMSRHVLISANDPQTIYVVSYFPSEATATDRRATIIKSADGGVTWGTETTLPYNTFTAEYYPMRSLVVSQRNVDVLYGLYPESKDSFGTYYRVYRSVNGGAGWSDYSGTIGEDMNGAYLALLPYAGNAGETRLYVAWNIDETGSSPDMKLYRYTGNTMSLDASPPTTIGTAGRLWISPLDSNNLIVQNPTATYITDDAGDNWTDLGEGIKNAIFFDDDPDAFLIWASDDVLYSNDFGANFTDKSGNLSSFTSPAAGLTSRPIGG